VHYPTDRSLYSGQASISRDRPRPASLYAAIVREHTQQMKIVLTATMLLLAIGPPEAHAEGLSPAESRLIAAQIARLHYPQERGLARQWSNAKKVAELLCRPAAMAVLREQVKGADRIFLGAEAPDSLRLDSNRHLSGGGSARSPGGWRDFTFDCQLDPRTGSVTQFQATLKP
jgi:hypothetical protein